MMLKLKDWSMGFGLELDRFPGFVMQTHMSHPPYLKDCHAIRTHRGINRSHDVFQIMVEKGELDLSSGDQLEHKWLAPIEPLAFELLSASPADLSNFEFLDA